MSKGDLNRSFANVLFGGVRCDLTDAPTATDAGGRNVRHDRRVDAALRLAYAERVIIGSRIRLAVSQAQHQMRELGDLIEKRGGDVRYAIHPVAGRMPGHNECPAGRGRCSV